MQGLSDASTELQTVVTGTHLSPLRDDINEIIDAGFRIDGRVHLDLQDDGRAAIAAIGYANTKLAAEFLRFNTQYYCCFGRSI